MTEFEQRAKRLLSIDKKKYLPYTIDHFDDDIPFQTAFKEFHDRINNVGILTTEYLELCAEEDYIYERQNNNDDDNEMFQTTFMAEQAHQKLVRNLYDKWSEELIATGESMKEIKEHIETFEEDNTVKTRKIRLTLGLHVFTEVTRLHYLINRPRIVMQDVEELEANALVNTKHPIWIEIYKSFDISEQYQKKEDKDKIVEETREQINLLWKCPINCYRQSELILIIMFLTQQLNDVKQDGIEEYRRIFHSVWLRTAEIMQQYHGPNVLNDPLMRVEDPEEKDVFIANRAFGVFNSYYVSEIMRRFFYYDLLSKRPLSGMLVHQPRKFVPSIKNWVQRIVNGMPEEAFSEMHFDSCTMSYKFVGDVEWYKYQNPQAIYSTNSSLMKLRPHLYRRYFSEEQVTKKCMLEAVNTSHVARMSMFKVMSNYIQTKIGTDEVQWYKGVVIHSDEIRLSAYNLRTNKAPLILQVFSSYWAYDQDSVYMTDDFYETIAVWFLLLKHRYDSLLHGHSFAAIINEALREPDNNEPLISKPGERAQLKKRLQL